MIDLENFKENKYDSNYTEYMRYDKKWDWNDDNEYDKQWQISVLV